MALDLIIHHITFYTTATEAFTLLLLLCHAQSLSNYHSSLYHNFTNTQILLNAWHGLL